jgi:hypothetical protein
VAALNPDHLFEQADKLIATPAVGAPRQVDLRRGISSAYRRYVPTTGFGSNIQEFAVAVVELYERRHAADYDPSIRVTSLEARLAVETARSALVRFKKATKTRREAFLTLLIFPPR